MKVTIKTVADLAGVSKSTVSRVMNNSKPVSDEVRKKVMDAIKETNFRPSSVARSLSNQKTQLIGVVIPDVANPVFSEIIKGIEDRAHDLDYNILLCNSRYDQSKELDYLEILKEQEVDGIILSGFHESDTLSNALKETGKPVVLIGFEDRKGLFSSVVIDNYKASKEVTQFLVKAGHNVMAMIHGPDGDICAGFHRKKAFIDVVSQENISYHTRLGHFTYRDGLELTRELLEVDEKITAIYCANDLMALGAIEAIRKSGKSVPDDIEVVGFDDIYLSAIYHPSLTTVKQPFEKKGRSSVNLLIEMINGKTQVQKIFHDYEIVIRDSTK